MKEEERKLSTDLKPNIFEPMPTNRNEKNGIAPDQVKSSEGENVGGEKSE